MKKLTFILPYYGKFHNYFNLFLKSCSYNKDIDWLIVTDIHYEKDIPNNVKFLNMSFSELKKLINSKMNLNCNFDEYHKLCDFKPSYGYIFYDYIKNYEFWGFCDCDLIFGNISKLLNFESIGSYQKIGHLGHMTIFKNTPENNSRFMTVYKEINYKNIFEDLKTTVFDEENKNSINNIYENLGIEIKPIEKIANIYTKTSRLRIINFHEKDYTYTLEKKVKGLFVFDNGNLYRYTFKKDKLIKKEEFIYIHLQARKMKLKTDNESFYKIFSDKFLNINGELHKEKTNDLNMHYFKIRYKNLKNKIRRKFGVK